MNLKQLLFTSKFNTKDQLCLGFIFAVLLLISLLVSSSLVSAHGESNAYHRLQGLELCMDSRSVSVAIDLGNFGESSVNIEELVGRLEPTLKSYISTTLSTSLVPLKEAKTCSDTTLLQSLFDIRPSGYAGDATLIVSALTHVGQDVSTQEVSTEETSLYYSFESSLEFLEDFPITEDFKVAINKAMILELVQNWWEDNPEAQATKKPKPIPQILGISLSLIILIAGIYIIKK